MCAQTKNKSALFHFAAKPATTVLYFSLRRPTRARVSSYLFPFLMRVSPFARSLILCCILLILFGVNPQSFSLHHRQPTISREIFKKYSTHKDFTFSSGRNNRNTQLAITVGWSLFLDGILPPPNCSEFLLLTNTGWNFNNTHCTIPLGHQICIYRDNRTGFGTFTS